MAKVYQLHSKTKGNYFVSNFYVLLAFPGVEFSKMFISALLFCTIYFSKSSWYLHGFFYFFGHKNKAYVSKPILGIFLTKLSLICYQFRNRIQIILLLITIYHWLLTSLDL